MLVSSMLSAAGARRPRYLRHRRKPSGPPAPLFAASAQADSPRLREGGPIRTKSEHSARGVDASGARFFDAVGGPGAPAPLFTAPAQAGTPGSREGAPKTAENDDLERDVHVLRVSEPRVFTCPTQAGSPRLREGAPVLVKEQYYGVFTHIGSAVTNGNITTCLAASGPRAPTPDMLKHVVILPFVTADPMCLNTP